MEIQVINLDRNADRLSTFTETNRHLNHIVRFRAVDGGEMRRENLCADGVFSTEMPAYSNGAVGCALSHLSLWQRAAEQSEALTIAEDDTIFNAHFEAEANALLQRLPPDWDIVLWGWNFDSILLFDFLPGVSPCLGTFSESDLRAQAATFPSLQVKPQAFRLHRAFGCLAYTVSPEGAQKLLNYCLPIREMDVPCPGIDHPVTNSGIDVMMNALYPEINAFVAFPPLAVSKNEKATSTVNRQEEGAADEPHNAGAYINLGNALQARGNFDGAMEHYRKALEMEPDNAGAHINLGNILRTRGQVDDAIAHYLRAIEIEPDNAGAHINLGNVLRARGNLDDALAHYVRALEIEPDNAGAHLNIGNALQARGKIDDAVEHYRKALEIRPDLAGAYVNLANVFQARGNFGDAIAHYRKALHLDPRHAVVHTNLGRAILGAQGKLDDAAACFEQALALKPDDGDALYCLASVFRAQGKLDDAAAFYQRTLALRPNHAEAHYNLGNVLGEQGKLDDALECYERALALKPDYADAHTNLMITLRDQGRLDDAMACCQRALAFYPDSASANFCDAYIRLLTGDFAGGWPKYEWRWLTKEVKPHGLTSPVWDGKDLGGRTILLHCEQGLGDNIQCIRYARLVKEKGGTVLLSCPPSLAHLFQDVAGIDGVFPDGRGLPEYDVHAPLMSLPGLFQTTLNTIPAGVPYLRSDPARVTAWRDRLAGYPGFKVGIVWRGSATHDRHRLMTAAQFIEFLDIPGLAVISLQKDSAAEEIEMLGRIPGPFLDAGPLQEDLSDAAAAVSNLDLVITVDTSVCHLAGALAAPVWTLIPFAPDWRWLLGREDSPWYPTMRLFRQPKIGDWKSVIERVRGELAERAKGARGK